MSSNLKKFVDKLPMMSKLKPTNKHNNMSYYDVRMKEFRAKLHRDLPPTHLWGYNGQFPGPLFDVNQGEPIQVKWGNHLPKNHILPVDRTIHNLANEPEVRTVTHLHGGVTETDSDGYPEAWYTNGFREVGPTFTKEIYEYSNNQRPMTLWYHDHAMGITRLNNYAGLSGMYIIRGKCETALNLPQGNYEIPLILVDRSFNKDGSLFYPRQPTQDPDNPPLPDPSIQPFFAGDTNLVNGKVWPYFEVEPRKYRFRLLNAANTRGYQLYFDSEEPFYQIGSDGGLLRQTVEIEKLTIEPAERIDVIIDFSKYEGQTIHLKNDLGPNADPDDRTDDVMQFRVTRPLKGKDTSRLPAGLSSIPSLKNNKVTGYRNLKLTTTEDKYARPVLLLNNKKWHDIVTEKPILGDTEIWSFMNITDFLHPMHIHLIQFQVLDRQAFDLDLYNETNQIIFTEGPKAPAPNERGWKDTVASPSGQITRVIIKFTPHTGRYVWHCHILEHEDYDMMRPFDVVDPDEDHK